MLLWSSNQNVNHSLSALHKCLFQKPWWFDEIHSNDNSSRINIFIPKYFSSIDLSLVEMTTPVCIVSGFLWKSSILFICLSFNFIIISHMINHNKIKVHSSHFTNYRRWCDAGVGVKPNKKKMSDKTEILQFCSIQSDEGTSLYIILYIFIYYL